MLDVIFLLHFISVVYGCFFVFGLSCFSVSCIWFGFEIVVNYKRGIEKLFQLIYGTSSPAKDVLCKFKELITIYKNIKNKLLM